MYSSIFQGHPKVGKGYIEYAFIMTKVPCYCPSLVNIAAVVAFQFSLDYQFAVTVCN